jgi:hypothetical protein
MRTLTTVALALLAASSASAGMFDDCNYTAPRSAAISLAGATSVRIIGRAGELRVTGARGVAEVRAKGTACTSDKGNLDRITLEATREGSTVRIEAKVPQQPSGIMNWGNNGLDFEVTVPDNLPLRIDDSSGEMHVENVASAEIHDSSGSLHVRNVSGNVEIEDSSGEITVDHVGGRVTIEDSSGSIDVDDVAEIEIPSDGSGGVEIRRVKRNVIVGSKGSGGISVEDVGGDLVVRSKGSGHIDHDGVRGRVDIPARKRR